MIELTRALARQIRTILRKSVLTGTSRSLWPPVVFQTGPDGLRIRTQQPDVAVEYHQPGSLAPEVLALPVEALADFEGRQETVVTLVATESAGVQARWQDSGVPQVRDYPVRERTDQPSFPELPTALTDQPQGLLPALEEAAQTVARDSTRYALQKLQLRGSTGQIVATDGRHLLIQGGFSFPWPVDILVPALGVFGCRELPKNTPVVVGKTATHLILRIGPWTFFLTVNPTSRYPNVEHILPSRDSAVSTCQLAPEDATFLVRVLPRLPGQEGEHNIVTVDLNGHAVVRARAEGQSQITEVVLNRSTATGAPVRFVTNRRYLARAVQLGFSEFQVIKPDVPVVCQEGQRLYLWMPLGKEGALPPSPDALTITADESRPNVTPSDVDKKPPPVASPPPNGNGHDQTLERSPLPVFTPPPNGHTNGHAADQPPKTNGDQSSSSGNSLSTLIEEAQALKELLHDAHGRAGRLAAALKRHRQQSRLLQTTLTSLRQLHHIDG